MYTLKKEIKKKRNEYIELKRQQLKTQWQYQPLEPPRTKIASLTVDVVLMMGCTEMWVHFSMPGVHLALTHG